MARPADHVERITSSPTIEIGMDADLQAVAQEMVENDVGAVVVTDAGKPVGLVSERDLVRALADGPEEAGDRASDLMTYEVVSIAHDETIEAAARKMVDGGIRHLAMTRDGKTAGVVSVRDVLRVYLEDA